MVTKRELVFVLIACSLAAGLLRTRNTAAIRMVWREALTQHYTIMDASLRIKGEKLSPPIVTHLDTGGLIGMIEEIMYSIRY